MRSHSRLPALATAAGVASALLLSACSATPPASEGDDEINIAWFTPSATNTWLAADYKGILEAADESGASVDRFDANFDATTQLGQMQDALTLGKYEILIVSPLNPAALVPVAEKARAQGVLVVSRLSTIGTDIDSLDSSVEGVITAGIRLSDGGSYIGQLIVKACEGIDPCRVAYLPGDAAQAADQIRTQAVKEELAKADNIELVAEQAGGFDSATGLAVTQNILTANAQLDVIAAASSQPIAGALQAVEQAGRTGEIALVSSGGTVEDLEGVRSGTIFGTVVSLPITEGRIGTELGIKAAQGVTVKTSVVTFALTAFDSPMVTKETLDSPEGADFEGEWTAG
jgi:ABC-type sugar transport system substrate-binding protein